MKPKYISFESACKAAARQGWRCCANMGTDGTWEVFFTKNDAEAVFPTDGDHYGAGTNLWEAVAEAFSKLPKLEPDGSDGPSAKQCNDILGKPGHYQ